MSRYDDDNGFGGSLNRPGREALDREEASWQAYSSKCEAITQSKLQAEIDALKAEGSKLKEALELISSLRGPFISDGDIAKCWDTVDEILNAQEGK